MFREDIYTRTLKYRRWNNELRPFCSLKKRVAWMFHKRNSYSDRSRGTSTQTIVNDIPEQCKAEVMEKDSETDSDRESICSNWSKLIPINTEINKPTKKVVGQPHYFQILSIFCTTFESAVSQLTYCSALLYLMLCGL